MQTVTIIPRPIEGTASNIDGSSVILDAALVQNCRMIFPKLPSVTFMLQRINLPEIRLNQIKQFTRYVDPNQIGEKVVFEPFQMTFIVDKYFKNWSSIFNWMKSLSVDGSAIDQTDNPIININGIDTFRFIGAWPTSLGNLTFDTTVPDAAYIKCTLTINYDYMDLLGSYQTIDSTYSS